MSSEFSILLLFLFMLLLVNFSSTIQRIKEANSRLDSDQKELAEFVYGKKRRAFGIYNFIFLILFVFAVGYLNRYFVFIGIIVMIYSWRMRSIFIKELVNDFSDMHFPKRYIGQIRYANKILYFSSFLMGIIAMIIAAHAYY